VKKRIRTASKVVGGAGAVVVAFALLNNVATRWIGGALVLCALCAIAYMWSEPEEKPSTPLWAKAVLAVWLLTLPVTILFAAISAMASEAGYSWSVYVFIGAAWTYPVSIVVAFILRRKLPPLVFLPGLNIIVWLWSGR
jgi:hypothetical protein